MNNSANGVRVEILLPTEGRDRTISLTWVGIVRGRGVLRSPLTNKLITPDTIATSTYAYTLNYYRGLRPIIRKIRRLARQKGYATRVLSFDILALDEYQGIKV